MDIPARTFIAPLVDEYGWLFKKAVVGILALEGNAITGLKSVNCEGNYAIENDVEAIAYKVMFYCSDETKAAGYRSRPLKREESGAFTDAFNVDMANPEVIEILKSGKGHEEKLLSAVIADIELRYS